MFTLKPESVLSLAILAALSPAALAQTATLTETLPEEKMDVMVVTADFRATSIEDVPASLSVLDRQRLLDDGGQNFQDVLNAIPNMNWSGGSSRARYFQIRGVGDQEEYQGAPNSSVGFFIDDIDLSGLGMASNLFDIEQVEVLRGPQSTLFGGNALAGAIYLKSAEPTAVTEAGAELTLGTDALWSAGAYASGALNADETLLGRVSVSSHKEDGFMDNAYLGRDDTNARDELSAKAKLRWYATDALQLDFTLLQGNFDNGYDAWSLDSNGDTTYSDRPGVDTQDTTAAGLKVTWQANDNWSLESRTSFADTKQRQAYDGDWANPEYWANLSCYGAPCVYDYWWDKTADRQNFTQELRLLSSQAGRIFAGTTDWLFGGYYNRLSEANALQIEQRYSPDPLDVSNLNSDYNATKLAGFAQLDTYLGQWHYSAGVRFEHWQSDYQDDSKQADNSFSPSENLWGGHVSVSYQFESDQMLYAKVSRGYKSGGFNMDLPAALSQYRNFDSETLYNYELGHSGSWFDGALASRVSVFYMDRQDQQVDASVQIPNSGDFQLYTANASSSTNYGLEAEATWYLSSSLELYGSLGLLKAKYDQYSYDDGYGGLVDLSGRELAHAPNYNYQLGGTWHSDAGWFANLNLTGMDAFYYSDSNDSVSNDYRLVNARLGYQTPSWSVYLWGRNLTDEAYGVRGFFFGNEPNLDWASQQYIRYGDPRQLGISFRYDYL
ncbi:TonB-dependent receptor [Shewanella sp. AS16]|uniref:TonB-dependent receptor n=1 Tax=Shewanella sp. AS16 TaxID=2907625 RepID=UPI001F181A5A|nr:TonB-dependent receptor [Shewanella sp. AS16]MCE9684825.1 TonB-dependent receptor [Shewanella sp. AS16]